MVHSARSGKKKLLLCHLGAFLTMTAWGASFVSTKVLLDNGLHPVEIYIYRFVLAYLLVLAVCHKKLLSNSWRDEGLFLLCGLSAGSIYFIAENTALQYTLATNVSLITSLSPLLTTIMLGCLYRVERPGRGFVLGSLIAFIGVALVVFNASSMIEVNPLGDMLALLAAVAWSLYSLVLRRLSALYDVMFISRKTFFYGVLTALPFVAIEPDVASPSLLLVPEVYCNLLFLGLFASMFGYVIWAWAVQGLGALTTSNYLYFQPVITLVISVWVGYEVLSWIGVTGCVFIIGGVYLSDRLKTRKI